MGRDDLRHRNLSFFNNAPALIMNAGALLIVN